jgi:hypothetical protein
MTEKELRVQIPVEELDILMSWQVHVPSICTTNKVNFLLAKMSILGGDKAEWLSCQTNNLKISGYVGTNPSVTCCCFHQQETIHWCLIQFGSGLQICFHNLIASNTIKPK